MTEAQVDYIAHLLKEAKDKNYNKPIVFLGAGMSVAGGIPLAGDIAKEILATYKNNPKVRNLKEEDRTYSKLMACLTTSERNHLLNGYIKEAKVNVAYIYLADLIKQGYVDYILTVNFDNLILRAMAMYNLFPPIYDLSILKDMTTDRIERQSVTYLHGTHRGLWMLNTEEEMDRTISICPSFFNRIAERRTWIVLGYSGEDRILDAIADLGSFSNNLYWVTYKDNEPNHRVKGKLLDRPYANSSLVRGYDADSFMMRLHAELGLSTPDILQSPFTSLLNTINSIVDVNDDDIYKNVKERLEINKRQIKDAIKRYEEGNTPKDYTGKRKEIDLLKKEIISYTTESNFNENTLRIEQIRQEVKKINNKDLDRALSDLYDSWALSLYSVNRYESAINTALKSPYPNNYLLACCYAELNETKVAIEYLRKSFEEDSSNEILSAINQYVPWPEIQKDPEFIALLNQYK
ncbi:TPR end-of-group domain-containing protein [Dysgonomonas macrotermitis]|uniref:SIR2-like domain-containing protein n=1 Tax=Dysgonomonas macrotermitis TaxID=1346286 RepID=A0A1M4Y611_9BACT|nr:hypothetical protein [Dysgonomonas macrotermitis]SHF01244.1 hypothetical protein SAMN05444362_10385 [Dysgonomonas macrotermitis]